VVEDQPLALCDAKTIEPVNLVACYRVVSNRLGEIYLLKHDNKQQWYWLERQTSDDVFAFVTWTSEADNTARGMPPVSPLFTMVCCRTLLNSLSSRGIQE
jgi:hypothetical protein